MAKKKKLSDSIKELEKIVEILNSDVEIEDAVEHYEKGIKLAGEIKKYLNEAEKKVTILTEDTFSEVDETEIGRKKENQGR